MGNHSFTSSNPSNSTIVATISCYDTRITHVIHGVYRIEYTDDTRGYYGLHKRLEE